MFTFTAVQAVPERDREELFHDAQKERDKREKEERKADRKRKAVAFKELLANTSGIKATSEWRKVGVRLSNIVLAGRLGRTSLHATM